MADSLLSYFIGNPCLLRSIHQCCSNTEQYLGRYNDIEARERAFEYKGQPKHKDTEDNRQATAIHISKNACWNLANKSSTFQDRSHQHQLQGIQLCYLYLIDHVNGKDDRKGK